MKPNLLPSWNWVRFSKNDWWLSRNIFKRWGIQALNVVQAHEGTTDASWSHGTCSGRYCWWFGGVLPSGGSEWWRWMDDGWWMMDVYFSQAETPNELVSTRDVEFIGCQLRFFFPEQFWTARAFASPIFRRMGGPSGNPYANNRHADVLNEEPTDETAKLRLCEEVKNRAKGAASPSFLFFWKKHEAETGGGSFTWCVSWFTKGLRKEGVYMAKKHIYIYIYK